MRSDIPLLVTSCAYPDAPFTALQSSKDRIAHTVSAVRQLRAAYPLLQIVICDGSDYDFAPHFAASDERDNLEILHFRNDAERSWKYGKGYGEGEIINYALAHSESFANARDFMKLTGKMFVKNLPRLLAGYRGPCSFAVQPNWRNLSVNSVDTRFWICSVKLYRSAFSDVHKAVRDRDGYFLEHAMAAQMVKSRMALGPACFRTEPILTGMSGSLGKQLPPRNWPVLRSMWHQIVRFLCLTSDIVAGRSASGLNSSMPETAQERTRVHN